MQMKAKRLTGMNLHRILAARTFITLVVHMYSKVVRSGRIGFVVDPCGQRKLFRGLMNSWAFIPRLFVRCWN